jgi:hypothetical protein
MWKNIKWLSLAVIMITAALSGNAQNNVGSPYTRYGLGDLMSKSFGDSRAMGNTSLAMRNGNKLYISNPASYTSIDSLHFIMEVGVSGAFKRLSSGSTDATADLYNMNLDYLAFGFPVTSWWGASLGVMPYSSVGYDLVTSETNLGYTTDYIYQGSGGLSQAYIGNSFSPIKNLSLGFNFNYMFGNIHQQNAVEFDGDTEDGLINITRENTMYVSDFYLTAGAQYVWDISDKNSLTFGLNWEMNSDLNAKRTLLVTNALSTSSDVVIDTIDYQKKSEGTISLPQGIGAGVAYQYKDILTLAADYSWQDWSNTKIFDEVDSLGVSQRISMGAEWVPDGKNSPGLNYAGKVRYRLGAYYEDSYLQFNQGNTRINDFGISFGLGLPLKRSNTTFNLSLQLGQRGSLKNNLVKEEYVMLGMNFSLSDIWFIKRKFE